MIEDFIPTFTTQDDDVTKMLDETAARAKIDDSNDAKRNYTNNLNESVIGNYKDTKLERIETILRGTSIDSQQLNKAIRKIGEII